MISLAPLFCEVYTLVTTILTNVVVTAGASANRWLAALCCRDTACVPAIKVSTRQNMTCHDLPKSANQHGQNMEHQAMGWTTRVVPSRESLSGCGARTSVTKLELEALAPIA